VKILGIPDRLVEHGTLKQLYDEIGLYANAIAAALRAFMNDKVLLSTTFQ